MAGGFPVGFQHNCVASSTPGIATPVLVTSGSTANTVGAYSELITSTPRDATWMLVQVQNSATATSGVISSTNISFGAAGSEVNVVNNLRMQNDSSSSLPGAASCYFFPQFVPAGTRIAANAQAGSASLTLRVALQLFDDAMGSIPGGGGIDTIGFNSATSGGVVVDPGGTGNTKGAWTQVSAGLTNDIAGFFLGFDYGSGATASFQYYWTMDVGVGASGSEVVLLPDFQIYGKSITNSKSIFPPNTPYFPIQIPAGTRVALRSQVNQTTANTSRYLGVTLYGVRL